MWSKGGYTDYDFLRMKQDAIQQAQEMSRRAGSGGSQPPGGKGDGFGKTAMPPPQSPPPNATETRCPRCGRIIRDGKHVYTTAQNPSGNRRAGTKGTPPPQNHPPPAYSPPPPSPFPPPQAQAYYEEPPDKAKQKLNLPFLGDIELDRDFLVIGGLLLVLLAEDGDKLLMMALVYILL